MSNLKELREQRQELYRKLEAVPATDKQAFEAAKAEWEAKNAEVERAEQLDDMNRRSMSQVPGFSDPTTTSGQPVTVNVIAERKADTEKGLQKQFRFGEMLRQISDPKQALTGMYAEVHAEGQKEARGMGQTTEGVCVPGFLAFGDFAEKRDWTAGTTTTGGHTIQTNVGELIPFLQPSLITEAAGVSMMRGLVGNVDMPRNDANGAAVWASEQGTSTETTPTFDKITLSPKRLTAFAELSKQLMIQSSMDAENKIRTRLSRYVANALDTAALAGSGSSNQPAGLSTLSGVNSVAIGTNGGAPTFAKIVEMESGVAASNADYGKLAYVTHPTLAGKLKQVDTASNAGRFLWTTSATPVVGDPGKVAFQAFMNGYRAFSTTLTPTGLTKGSSSDCIAIYYGNWEEMVIGQWGGVDIIADPYTRAKDATTVFIINSFWDVQVLHAAAFSRCLDARNV